MAPVGQSILMDEYRKCIRKHGRRSGSSSSRGRRKAPSAFFNARPHTFKRAHSRWGLFRSSTKTFGGGKGDPLRLNDTFRRTLRTSSSGLLIILSVSRGFSGISRRVPLEENGVIDEDRSATGRRCGQHPRHGGMATNPCAEIIMNPGLC